MEKETIDKYIRDGERADDLQCGGLFVLQKPSAFCFGTDSVLLAHFAALRKNARVTELCAGCGVISLLLAARYPSARFTLVEIQNGIADMARRSVLMNGLEERMSVVCGDLREISGNGQSDAVVVNPPYQRVNDGADRSEQAIARKEILCTLDDVTAAASRLLNDKGKLYMVHRTDRFADIVCSMRAHGIEAKRVCTVGIREGEAPKLLLIEGVKGAGADIRWMPPLILYGADGALSERIKEIYDGGEI